uniref:D-Ala-D-Ala dipeptidase n=1 Tax=Ditylenchus dipsaci TaxID=166011 RepID=A0A915D381_9BILA
MSIQSSVPADFVFIDDIIPTIKQNLRYNTNENFMGHPLPGYSPMLAQRTVDYFFEWFKNSSDQSKKTYYYPNQDLKKPEIRDKYFTPTSGHSRGSTLDLTIIKLGKDVKEVNPVEQTLSDGRKILRLDDGSLDVGGSFDLFDDSSYHNTTLITDQQKEMRAYLKKVMDQHGFDAFVPEWWHYNLRDEPILKLFSILM